MPNGEERGRHDEFYCEKCQHDYKFKNDYNNHLEVFHKHKIPEGSLKTPSSLDELLDEMKLIVHKETITEFKYTKGNKKKVKEIKTEKIFVNNVALQRAMTLFESKGGLFA